MTGLGEDSLPAPRRATLTEGRVGRTLLALTGPMLVGHLAVAAFSLVDTYFVARLGTDALAAMTFTFPVVMFVGGLTVGLGIGAGSAISRAIGQGDHHRVRRLTTNALMLAVLVVPLFVAAGLATIRPLFSAMGAKGRILDMVEGYMTVWYVGMVFVVVPMVGNNAIRATGDTVTPSAIMICANLINLALDPLLIFGLWGLPRMGMTGAAVATVIGRGASLVAALAVLRFGKRMLTFSLPSAGELLRSWGRILYVGLPAATTILLGPVTLGVITRIVSRHGSEAVAAVGAGGRCEMFAMMVVIALASVMVPFVGQNWGAGRFDRVRAAHRAAERFALLWGLVCLGVLSAAAGLLTGLFSADPVVLRHARWYLWVVPWGYGLMGLSIVTCSGLNAINRPLQATALGGTRMLVLIIPLAYAGGLWFGPRGVFLGMAAGNVLGGLAAIVWVRRLHRAVLPPPEG